VEETAELATAVRLLRAELREVQRRLTALESGRQSPPPPVVTAPLVDQAIAQAIFEVTRRHEW
jgi:hypothetical protein